jgi:hypothetical protein
VVRLVANLWHAVSAPLCFLRLPSADIDGTLQDTQSMPSSRSPDLHNPHWTVEQGTVAFGRMCGRFLGPAYRLCPLMCPTTGTGGGEAGDHDRVADGWPLSRRSFKMVVFDRRCAGLQWSVRLPCRWLH